MNLFTIQLTPLKKHQLICLALCLGIVGVFIISSLATNLALTKITTAQQQLQTETVSRRAGQDQADFFQTQTEIITTINQALPGQNDLVNLVKAIENLQTLALNNYTFGFSSLLPIQESNQYYLPFNLRFQAPLIETIDFLRRLEKVPYLAKISSLTAKTPNGLSGILEITISGRVYVQDNFKN